MLYTVQMIARTKFSKSFYGIYSGRRKRSSTAQTMLSTTFFPIYSSWKTGQITGLGYVIDLLS